MMPRRITTLAALLTASAALSTTASAQSYAFAPTDLGSLVPARFATTTQQLLASVDAGVTMPIVAEEASSSVGSDALPGSAPTTAWDAIGRNDAASDESDADDEQSSGVFGSMMGRASIAGLAGLAGASYFALRDGNGAEQALSYTLGDTKETTVVLGGSPVSLPDAPVIVETPEPATIALLAIGMAGLGLVARRRRTS